MSTPSTSSAPSTWRGEAPGRLDFLGGVADYSGSLVLEIPTRVTTRVSMRVSISRVEGESVRVASTSEGEFSVPLRSLQVLDAGVARSAMDALGVPGWARYSLGCIALFCAETGWRPDTGLSLRIKSDVPTSMGVSSSAALEVATLRALQEASGKYLEGTFLARLAQKVENEVVGAPCGLMDQLASAHGTMGKLLPILCRPDILGEPVALPPNLAIVGWPSGAQHAVADSPYATARAAAFMAKKILEARAGRKVRHLCEFSSADILAPLPEQMEGADFNAQFHRVDDPLSRLEPARMYPVEASGRFGIEENERCHAVVEMLRDQSRTPDLSAIGAMMAASHASYSAMGLGHAKTDAMVAAVHDLGARNGFHGARVSGGGSGGTVVVLLDQSAVARLEELAREFQTPPLISG